MDSIQASKFLSDAENKRIKAKLKKLCSRYEGEKLDSEAVLVANRVKSMNNSIFENLGAIQEAIRGNYQIKYKYYGFKLDKQYKLAKEYRRKGAFYVVSPWALVYADDNYYLLAYDHSEKEIRTYRVDRMDNVAPTIDIEKADPKLRKDNERQGKEAFDAIDKSLYTRYTFSMYKGDVKKVTMVFQNGLMSAVIDRFGKDLFFTKEDEWHFKVTVPVAVSPQFYGWVAGLGKKVRIVHPVEIKEDYEKFLMGIVEHSKKKDQL